jgi:hypothetical protein
VRRPLIKVGECYGLITSDSGAHMFDLIQEGNTGRMNAVSNFTERPVGGLPDYVSYASHSELKLQGIESEEVFRCARPGSR